MPRLSSLFVRAALVYLGLGFTLGGLTLANKGIFFSAQVWNWLPAHIEFLLVGWLLQLAMGMSFWILPRLGAENPRGNEYLMWVAFLLINSGIWLVVIASFTNLPKMAPAGRMAEAAAGALFALGTWKRVKPFMA